MPHFFESDLELTVAGPLLCSATGVSTWGVDAMFQRDHQGRCIIPGSHVKGKLREAWRELKETGGLAVDIERCLGRESADGDYLPHRAEIVFSDFTYSGPAPPSFLLHRIRMNPQSGTAEEGALLCIESPFRSGMPTKWRGSARFPAPDLPDGQRLHEELLQGLRWITAIGAEKGVGFGRLLEVTSIALKHEEAKVVPEPCQTAPKVMGLFIRAVDPILIGGVRMKDNYLESETILTGTVLKGALAQCLRRRLRLPPEDAIKPSEIMTKAGLDLLGKHFEGLRFTHAFPSRSPARRPVQYPLSLTKTKSGILRDVALSRDGLLFERAAPQFRIDWKDASAVDSEYGWSSPEPFSRTRTKIHALTRRAEEEKLYTFQYIYPEKLEKCSREDESQELEAGWPTERFCEEWGEQPETVWMSNVFLPEGLSEQEYRTLAGELLFVVRKWLDCIGKRDGRINALVCERQLPPATPCRSPVQDGTSIITLQSDALMLNPWTLADGESATVEMAYRSFWDEVSAGTFELTRYFAAEKLVGGYLGRRFKVEGRYFPFLLTNAGSVFVLKATGKGDGDPELMLQQWLRNGLPTAAWALDKYGKTSEGRLDWRKCPFTRENGFGEILVNLACHWKQNQ